ncbi:MAG: hypothetical protein IKZ26_02675 [Peptococcaceae bacterium]|nr:hypothetical protein [Peptococcaceae bacterium]
MTTAPDTLPEHQLTLPSDTQTINYYDRFYDPMDPERRSESPAVLRDYPPNDLGNARRFLDICRDFVRYCPPEKCWYIFDRTCWKPDTANLIHMLAQTSLNLSYQKEFDHRKEIASIQELQSLMKNQTRAGNLSTIQNCLGVAAAYAVIQPEQFDADPDWFHTQDGAINMQTWDALLYHERRLLFTKTAGASLQLTLPTVSRDITPDCPRWIQFVKECCSEDDELYRYLQKAAAYSILTGDISQQKVFCLLGSGRNGKSLFINTLAAVAGDYARKIEASVLCVNRFGDKDADTSKELYRIRGSRFVYSNEFGRNSFLNENFIKAITDGGRIACRPLYGSSIEYAPTYTLWFSTNHMPNLQAMDEGIRRRIVVIPFRNSLREDQIDRTLPEALRNEANGILYWLLQGYSRYITDGLTPPQAVHNATASYFSEQDPYQIFLDEYYTISQDDKVYAKTLYQNYVHWCAENGEKPVSNTAFGKELQRLGIARTRDRKGYCYALREKEPDSFTE